MQIDSCCKLFEEGMLHIIALVEETRKEVIGTRDDVKMLATALLLIFMLSAYSVHFALCFVLVVLRVRGNQFNQFSLSTAKCFRFKRSIYLSTLSGHSRKCFCYDITVGTCTYRSMKWEARGNMGRYYWIPGHTMT